MRNIDKEPKPGKPLSRQDLFMFSAKLAMVGTEYALIGRKLRTMRYEIEITSSALKTELHD